MQQVSNEDSITDPSFYEGQLAPMVGISVYLAKFLDKVNVQPERFFPTVDVFINVMWQKINVPIDSIEEAKNDKSPPEIVQISGESMRKEAFSICSELRASGLSADFRCTSYEMTLPVEDQTNFAYAVEENI